MHVLEDHSMPRWHLTSEVSPCSIDTFYQLPRHRPPPRKMARIGPTMTATTFQNRSCS